MVELLARKTGTWPVLRLWLLFVNGLRLRHYRRAQREIHPLNPDVGKVLRRKSRLEDERLALVRA